MNKGWYVVIGGLAVLAGALQQPSLLLVSFVLALIAAISWLWARYCLAGVSYQRQWSATRLYYGEEADVRIEVVNAKPLPLAWLRVDDQMPVELPLISQHQPVEKVAGRQLARRDLVNVYALRWYERVTRRYKVRADLRGVWSFGPAQLRSGDLFGFRIQRAEVEQVDKVLVYPRLIDLPTLALPARHPFGDFRTPRRVIEDPLRLTTVREYMPGDNFRHIHWKASAQRQQLQTKVFEPSAARPTAIFLNISTTDVYYYGFDWALRELAICAAATLARQVWISGQSVGLYVNTPIPGSAQPIRVQPRKQPAQLVEILTALAQINEGMGRWRFENLLRNEASRLPYGATLVVVSALITPLLEQSLLDLHRRGFGVTLVTLGAARLSKALPGLGYLHIDNG